MAEVRHEPWSAAMNNHKLIDMRQNEGKTIADCHKRFKNTVEVTKSQWGMFHPMKIAKNDEDHKDDSEKAEVPQRSGMKFLACLFLHGACREHHGKCVDELKNIFLSGGWQ